jgi:hypothetical protein
MTKYISDLSLETVSLRSSIPTLRSAHIADIPYRRSREEASKEWHVSCHRRS